jgi:quercetin dioxygenase-like cupin family protein
MAGNEKSETSIRVQKWSEQQRPDEAQIKEILDAEGLPYYRWSNGPGDVYAAHSHAYHKIIYVIQGSITLGLPYTGEEVELHEGDRLDLPAGIMHDALVGSRGVVCLEAHRS